MALAEFERAKVFYEKTYGVKVAAPVEPRAPLAKTELTQEMREYLASVGRKGGQSKSPAKIAASSRNIKIASGRQP